MGANHHVKVKEREKSVPIKERELPITIRLNDRTSLDSYIENCNLSENSPDRRAKRANSIPMKHPQLIKKQSSNQSSQNYFTDEKLNRRQNLDQKDYSNVQLQTWDSNTIIKRQQFKGGSPNKKITINSIMNEIQSNRVAKNGQFKQSLNHEDMRGFFYHSSQNRSKKDLKLIRLHSIKSNQFSGDNIKKITLPEIEQLSRESSSMNVTCFPCYQTLNNIFENDSTYER